MPKTFLSPIAAIIIAPAIISSIMVVLVLAGPSSAQTNSQRAQHPTHVRVHQEPCWQQVGISKDVIDQRKAVELDTRSQVQAVCADSSLSDQQKKQKIHEIHQESKQKVAGLMTEQQQQDLQSCQKERAANHPAPAGTRCNMEAAGLAVTSLPPAQTILALRKILAGQTSKQLRSSDGKLLAFSA